MTAGMCLTAVDDLTAGPLGSESTRLSIERKVSMFGSTHALLEVHGSDDPVVAKPVRTTWTWVRTDDTAIPTANIVSVLAYHMPANPSAEQIEQAKRIMRRRRNVVAATTSRQASAPRDAGQPTQQPQPASTSWGNLLTAAA